MSELPNLTVVDHPLIRHKLALLRSVDTPTKLFRELVEEMAMLLMLRCCPRSMKA